MSAVRRSRYIGVVMPDVADGLSVAGRPSPQARVALNGRVDRLDEFGAGWKIVSRHAVPTDLFTDDQQKVLEELGVELAHVSRAYPGPVDVRYASEEAVQFFTSFFTAKTRRQIEETHAHFHPDQTSYADATLGWHWSSNEELRGVWKQYMPFWAAGAKSYPVQVLGDTTGAAVLMTDTPELFGGEIRAIAIVDFVDDKVVRWVDYWDGRGFGADAVAKMAAEVYPEGLGVDTVGPRQAPGLGAAVEQLMAVIGSGDDARLDDLLAYDATLEDFALRTKIRGRSAIGRYLGRASGRLPYQGAAVSLLEPPRGHRRRHPGRLVPLRRHRHPRRRGLLHHRRPQEGPDHPRSSRSPTRTPKRSPRTRPEADLMWPPGR
jgi:hypothetical protein